MFSRIRCKCRYLKRIILSYLFVFLLIPATLCIFLAGFGMQRDFTLRQLSLCDNTATYISQLCNQILYNLKTNILFLYNDKEIMDALEHDEKKATRNDDLVLSSRISSIFYSNPRINSISIYWERNNTLITRKKNSISRNFRPNPGAVSEYFAYSFPRDSFGLSLTAVTDPATAKTEIVLNQNIFNSRLMPVARLEFHFDCSVFAAAASSPDSIKDTSILLLDREKNVLFSNQDTPFSREDIAMLSSCVASQDTVELDGKKYYVFLRTLERYNIALFYCIPQDSVTSLYLPYKNILLSIAVILFMLLVFTAWAMSGKITRPLDSLIRRIDTFRNSPLASHTSQRQPQCDILEINQLSSDFDAMMEELDTLIHQKVEFDRKEQQAQMKMLMLRIDPHFINNALQSLSYMAIQHGCRDIHSVTLSISSILKYSLSWGESNTTLLKEFEICRQYLTVQKYRYLSDLELNIDVDEDLSDIPIPKMILQPILENAFIHGFKNKTEQYLVGIRITQQAIHISRQVHQETHILLYNNGALLTEEQLQKLNRDMENNVFDFENIHSGLMSSNYRLKKLYPQSAIVVDNSDGLFCVRITIREGSNGSTDH